MIAAESRTKLLFDSKEALEAVDHGRVVTLLQRASKEMPHEKDRWLFYRRPCLERLGLAHRVRKDTIWRRPSRRACI